jgi:hypothetical protein
MNNTSLIILFVSALAANTTLWVGYWIKRRDLAHCWIGWVGYMVLGAICASMAK